MASSILALQAPEWLQRLYDAAEEDRELDEWTPIGVSVDAENKEMLDFLTHHGVATGDVKLGAIVEVYKINGITSSWFFRKNKSRACSM
jgi:hypothetical protein